MEDLDPPREQTGAAHSILRSLQAHGLQWDQQVLWQSDRQAAYDALIEDLLGRGLAFRCDCSRQMLAATGGIYNGHCRERNLDAAADHAVRIRVSAPALIEVSDTLQKPLRQDIETEVGDFVIRRRDGLTAYQLAVVMDDAWQGITHVVRGSDLYDSTPRQVYLQRILGLPTPVYTHIPVLSNDQGQKLSKQTHAPAIDNSQAPDNLRKALAFLGQPAPPAELGRVEPVLDWALGYWKASAIPRRLQIPESGKG